MTRALIYRLTVAMGFRDPQGWREHDRRAPEQRPHRMQQYNGEWAQA
jgi:hypothetical protein